MTTKANSAQGFSLIELMIAVTILAMSLMTLIATMTYTQRLDTITMEKTAAMNTLRRVTESLAVYSESWDNLRDFYSYYNGNDKGCISPAPLSAADIEELEKGEWDDGGTIRRGLGLKSVRLYSNGQPVLVELFPFEGPNATPNPILRNADLNGDGNYDDPYTTFVTGGSRTGDVVSGGTLSTNCKLVPVRLTIDWRGLLGPSDAQNKLWPASPSQGPDDTFQFQRVSLNLVLGGN